MAGASLAGAGHRAGCIHAGHHGLWARDHRGAVKSKIGVDVSRETSTPIFVYCYRYGSSVLMRFGVHVLERFLGNLASGQARHGIELVEDARHLLPMWHQGFSKSPSW